MTVNTQARELKNRVRERRVALNLTQADVAARAGISRQTLISIEKDDGYRLMMPLALRLAAILDTDVGVLFYEEPAA